MKKKRKKELQLNEEKISRLKNILGYKFFDIIDRLELTSIEELDMIDEILEFSLNPDPKDFKIIKKEREKMNSQKHYKNVAG